MDDVNARLSLNERIACANAARKRAAFEAKDSKLVEAQRRVPFDVCDVYRVYAEDILEITGVIAGAVPSRAAYFANTDPQASARPENRSTQAYAQIENPACVFVWELRHNKKGALAALPDDAYGKVLDATDRLKNLWENEPWQNELQLAKALIAQIVLEDDDLRKEVFARANVLVKECCDAVAPYLQAKPDVFSSNHVR